MEASFLRPYILDVFHHPWCVYTEDQRCQSVFVSSLSLVRCTCNLPQ
jgi:hypothetical protein